MTEPTDAEIMREASKVGGLFDDLAIGYQSEDILKFARAVLARRGQPSGAGEPVYQFRRAHCSDWYDGHADHGDGGGPYEERTLYTTPQPTQAQTADYIRNKKAIKSTATR